MDASSLLRKWQTWAVAGVVLIAILPDDSENAGDTTSVTSVVTESPQAPVSVPASPVIERLNVSWRVPGW